jgi:transposase
VLVETFIRKQLRLKTHRVSSVELEEEQVVVRIDRLRSRMLRCGLCGHRCRKVHSAVGERRWRDLTMRGVAMVLRYRPRRVNCPRCGVRVEQFPWAPPWARVTQALAHAVAVLARLLSWQETARH